MAVIRFVTVFFVGFVLLVTALMIVATRAFRRRAPAAPIKGRMQTSPRAKRHEPGLPVRPKRVWQVN